MSLTRPSLEIIRQHGLAICTLTKGGTRALADIDLFRPDRDAFASTMTSLDDRFSQKWESGAALPGDRIAALKAFHGRGIFTWVSLEPTIDVEASLSIVDATNEFVDLFKVGRVNYLPITKTEDWRDYTLRMIELLQRLDVKHYIKKDLQPFLPAGYPNQLRVPQHH
jgi:DNA repair photolyase